MYTLRKRYLQNIIFTELILILRREKYYITFYVRIENVVGSTVVLPKQHKEPKKCQT